VKLTASGVGAARLVEKRSDDTDNVKLTNALRKVANGEGRYFRQITTTDNTVTEIWRDTVNADSAVNLEISVVSYGLPTPTFDVSSLMRRQAAYRVGTTPTVLATTWDTIGTDVSGGPTISIAAVGGDVVLSVQGRNGQTINWNARIVATWAPYQ
jgi:hypothetical protein